MNKWIGLSVMLLSGGAFSLSGNPNQFDEPNPPVLFGGFQKHQYYIDKAQYIPGDHPVGIPWRHPVAIIRPQVLPIDYSLKLQVRFSGYSARPDLFCTGNDFSKPGYIVIKSCAGHFPDLDQHLQTSGVKPLGWWGWYLGDSNSQRIGLALSKAWITWITAVDLSAGVRLSGGSYGGTAVLLQSMILRHSDAWWGNLITFVRSDIAQTDLAGIGGLYQDPNPAFNASVREAWGDADAMQAHFETQAANGTLDDIFYRINGSPRDTSVRFDLNIFQHMNTYKISGMGTWHDAGHAIIEPGINLPFYADFASPEMEVRLDAPLPVFTNSTANYFGASRGHYNMGWAWDLSGIRDWPALLKVPIRYVRTIGIGGGIPDQPLNSAVDVTIRRLKSFDIQAGQGFDWVIASTGQSGTEIATKAGELTIPSVLLVSSTSYANLIIMRSTHHE